LLVAVKRYKGSIYSFKSIVYKNASNEYCTEFIKVYIYLSILEENLDNSMLFLNEELEIGRAIGFE